MTSSKRDLIEAFLRGDMDHPDASRESLKVVTTPDGNEYRCIIGYAWAVYAAEIGIGTYALFGDGYASHGTDVGWAGFSGQTTQHLQEIKGMFEEAGVDYVVVDFSLKWGHVRGGTWTPPEVVEEFSTQPAPGTGYTRTL